jgi:hypothetical protein
MQSLFTKRQIIIDNGDKQNKNPLNVNGVTDTAYHYHSRCVTVHIDGVDRNWYKEVVPFYFGNIRKNTILPGHYPWPFFYLKHNVSETGFCFRLQVEPTQAQSTDLVPISRHLHQHKIGHMNQAQHKASARIKTNNKNGLKTLHLWDLAPVSETLLFK